MTIQHRTVDIEAAAKLWKDDLSASQIAKRFGVSRNVIVALAYRNRSLFPWRGEAGKKTSARGPRKAAEARADTPAAPASAGDPGGTGDPGDRLRRRAPHTRKATPPTLGRRMLLASKHWRPVPVLCGGNDGPLLPKP
jgi:hypothetical protein